MSETHTWVKHADTGHLWQCPTDIVDEMARLGWEPTDDRPVEPNPAVDERIAWLQAQREAAEAETASEDAAATAESTTRTRSAARRGASTEE